MIYTYLEQWAQIQVILTYIGLGALALFVLVGIIFVIYCLLSNFYKKHSKKYEWDCVRNCYVKKEKNNE